MNNSSKWLMHISLGKKFFNSIKKYFIPNTFIKKYDKFLYIVVFVAPLSNIPQLMKVWVDKNASWVSAISWFSFAVISLSWLIYWILHKDKHITIMNFLFIIVQSIIAIGALVYW